LKLDNNITCIPEKTLKVRGLELEINVVARLLVDKKDAKSEIETKIT
jgi:hypothetical protein